MRQGSSPKPKRVSFGERSSGSQNFPGPQIFSGPQNFRLPNMGSGATGQFAQLFYPRSRGSYNYQPRFNRSSSCGGCQFHPSNASEHSAISLQPRRCPRCGLRPHPHIQYCRAINLSCSRCHKRGHFARAVEPGWEHRVTLLRVTGGLDHALISRAADHNGT